MDLDLILDTWYLDLILHYNYNITLYVYITLAFYQSLQWTYIYRFHHSIVSSFYKFIPTCISNNILDASKLLLLSGDVETNSGPRPINMNPVFCTICSSKINRGIDTRSTCSDTKCNARCHQACNGLSTNQTRHPKTCWHTIMWKCLQHVLKILFVLVMSA